MSYKLSEIATYISVKIDTAGIALDEYISTENMLPDKGGVKIASSLPSTPKTNSFQIGDVLFSNIRTYFRKVWFASFNGGVSSDVLVIRSLNENILLSKYLYYLLSSEAFIRYTVKTAKGTKMPRGNKDAIMNYEFDLPSIAIQKKIIHILSALDDKIELNRNMNKTIEEMVQALFKSWFIDFDFVHSKVACRNQEELARVTSELGISQEIFELFPNEFEDSDMGIIPKGWIVKEVGDCKLTIESGSRPKGGIDKSLLTGVPSVGAESIASTGKFDYGKVKYVTNEFASKTKRGWVKNLDVALYKDGGKPGLFMPRVAIYGNSFPFQSFMINEHVFLLRSTELEPYFLYTLVSSPEFLRQLVIKGSAKAAQPGLNQSEVKNTKFILAPDEILYEFNKVTKSLIDKQLDNGMQMQVLRNMRETLLPKLLSGEVEV